MPDPDEIKRQLTQLQKDLAKTEEALARLRKKIVKPEGNGKGGKKKDS